MQELKNMQNTLEIPLSIFNGSLFRAFCLDAKKASDHNDK